ncbi:MAG: LysR family transcriptional regulator [Halioglobus sp.]
MSKWNIKKLPLLETFNAIMMNGSVVAAAEAMNITQSAVSKQLAQLRDWLGDELFVRTRDGMQPTPRALAISEQVRSILEQASELVSDEQVLPADFAGQFVISATDEILEQLVPPLVNQLVEQAPRMRLVTLPLARDYLVRQLEAGQVNLVVAVNWHSPELLMQKRLFSEEFVCVMHRDHPLAGSNLTLKRFADATHVMVAPLGSESGIVDVELQRLGLKRWVCASVSAFHLINPELLGTSRIVTLPRGIAERLVKRNPFVIKPAPLTLPKTDYYALWHPRFSAEPRFRWILELVEAVLAK